MPERLDEHCEILARHYSKAEEWPKALEYFLMAARKAAQAFAIREALTLYDQALEATGHLRRAGGREHGHRNSPGEVDPPLRGQRIRPCPRRSRAGRPGRAPARRSHARGQSVVPDGLGRRVATATWKGAVANAQAAIRVAGPIGDDARSWRAPTSRSGTCGVEPEPSRRPARRSGTPSTPDGRAGIRPIHHCLSPWPGNSRTGRGTTGGRRNSKPRPSSWRASTTT